MRTSSDSVVASFQSTISVEFKLRVGVLSALTRIPTQFNGALRGLLGNFDGNPKNDFIYRNGTIASDSISDREKHSVAQSCKWILWYSTELIFSSISGQVSQEESLFFYEEGENVSTVSNPKHLPVFLDEINNVTVTEAVEFCEGLENIECVYDFVLTRNIELALSTMSTNKENNEMEQFVGKNSILKS